MEGCIYNSRLPQYKEPFGAVAAGETVTFRLHLPKSYAPNGVFLLLFGDDLPEQPLPMSLEEVCSEENIYRCDFCPPEPRLYFYHFRFWQQGQEHLLLADENCRALLDMGGNSWQLTVYDGSVKAPACIGDGVLYQIFPDRFYCSGQPKEGVPADRLLRKDWGELPVYRENEKGVFTCNDYFGGDLRGIEEKLDLLQSLGVSCIYLNPIFEAQSNHRYNVADYLHIDPLLGTEEDFRSLCKAAKKRGIAILLDGVFSHTGSDSVYFNREGRYGSGGAWRDPESPYRDWYQFKGDGREYSCWWGFLTLPNVREETPSYLDFICRNKDSVIHHWMEAGASGFRLDVADELPDVILDEIHKAVKAHGEDCCIIGEVWEDASNKISYGQRRRYLLGGQLDSVMNYPFRRAVLGYIRSGDGAEFLSIIGSIVENYPPAALSCAMNPLSTHDTQRAITVLAGEDGEGKDRLWQAEHHYLSLEQYQKGVARLKLAASLQYFLPGVPSLYYGDEAGLSGYKDPFCRCCYPWGHEDQELLRWYQRLGQLRKSRPYLREARFVPLCANDSLCAYLRQGREGQQLLVAVNRGEQPCALPLPPAFVGREPELLCGSYSEEVLAPDSAVLFHLD